MGARVFVTNDDGVHAPGLSALAAALHAAGYDVTVGAPLDDRSGSGASIGAIPLSDGIEYRDVVLPGLESVRAYGIDAPPAVAVMAARLRAFGDPPDLIVSGINPGANTGRAVLHSGTVGAALTAANFGAKGLAISLDTSEPMRWDTAAAFAVDATAWLLGAPPRTVLSVNVPGRAPESILGVRVARLAAFGTVRATIAGNRDGRLELELSATDVESDPDTDTALVAAGYVSVSALAALQTVADLGESAVEVLAGVMVRG